MGLTEFHLGFIVGVSAGAGLFISGLLVGLVARLLDSSIVRAFGTRKEDKEEWTEEAFEEAYYGAPGDMAYTPSEDGPSDELLEKLAELNRHSA